VLELRTQRRAGCASPWLDVGEVDAELGEVCRREADAEAERASEQEQRESRHLQKCADSRRRVAWALGGAAHGRGCARARTGCTGMVALHVCR
jgi:hypothetical protein